VGVGLVSGLVGDLVTLPIKQRETLAVNTNGIVTRSPKKAPTRSNDLKVTLTIFSTLELYGAGCVGLKYSRYVTSVNLNKFLFADVSRIFLIMFFIL
jgi:hypothetical protein